MEFLISENISLKKHNTFGLDVRADFFATFESTSDLIKILKHPVALHCTPLILGGGSNMLFTTDVPGLVLKNNLKGITVEAASETAVLVTAGAGEVWHDLVLYAIDHGYGGIENLSLIPGSVGAAPMQNIGAYGVEIKDVFEKLTALDLGTMQTKVFSAETCQFGYRESVFKRELNCKYIILDVTLRLKKSNYDLNTTYGAIGQQLLTMGVTQATIKDVSQAVIAIRQSKLPDPSKIGNAGSFFKNPIVSAEQFEALKKNYPDIVSYPGAGGTYKLAAGWLIEYAGWKGKTFGNYGVHKDQALVLVNYGNASGADIYALSEEICQSIKALFAVELEREVNII